MSFKVTVEVSPPGDKSHVEPAWELKEIVREEEGVLKQRRGFFVNAYRRSRAVCLFEGDDLIGFIAARRDGYILFLVVHPDHRDQGLGKRLVGEIAKKSDSVTCHARATNDRALGFYEHLGFERVRRVDNYYEDGGDAFYLRLGDRRGLIERISDLLQR
ncbi:MAG: GNAT family N-acetyltransferase [Halobacteriaceae archaeon]